MVWHALMFQFKTVVYFFVNLWRQNNRKYSGSAEHKPHEWRHEVTNYIITAHLQAPPSLHNIYFWYDGFTSEEFTPSNGQKKSTEASIKVIKLVTLERTQTRLYNLGRGWWSLLI